jgi:arylsulfatase A-like enzyme
VSIYEEDIHVPFVIRGPGIPAGTSTSALVGNVDLAATLAQLAGASVPAFVDGRSFVPFLMGGSPDSWRDAYLLEHWKFRDEDADGGPPDFIAIRTGRYLYVEYSTAELELYDLSVDPYELDNLAATADPALLARLHAKLAGLATCAAAGCRIAD